MGHLSLSLYPHPKFQALAYTAVGIGKSYGPPDEKISYYLVSVTVAFFLLSATAAQDLRMGFSLLVDGTAPLPATYRFSGIARYSAFLDSWSPRR